MGLGQELEILLKMLKCKMMEPVRWLASSFSFEATMRSTTRQVTGKVMASPMSDEMKLSPD